MNKSTTITIVLVVIILGGIVLFGGRGSENLNLTNTMTDQTNNSDVSASDNATSSSDVDSNATTSSPLEDAKALQIDVIVEGDGQVIENGNTAVMHYTGTFEDGTVFDSSVERGTPFEFALGAGQVIAGWDQGILGMKVGEKRKLTIPSDLGYGDNGYGPIPGGATLIFDVELLGIK